MINIFNAVKTAERCQRNWDHSKPVLEEDIQKIVEVATTMPTKNNRNYYDLVVSTNPEFNRTCYKYAVDPINAHFKNKEIHRNTQVDAPLLLMWKTTNLNDIDNPFNNSYQEDFHVSVGISSGAAVLTANQLGYRTGYCQCFDIDSLIVTLDKKFNLSIVNNAFSSVLTVGIGYPDSNFERTQCVIDGKLGYTAESVNKTIDITYIE